MRGGVYEKKETEFSSLKARQPFWFMTLQYSITSPHDPTIADRDNKGTFLIHVDALN